MEQLRILNNVVEAEPISKNATSLKIKMKIGKLAMIVLLFSVGSNSFTFAQQIKWALEDEKRAVL